MPVGAASLRSVVGALVAYPGIQVREEGTHEGCPYGHIVSDPKIGVRQEGRHAGALWAVPLRE